MKSESLSHRRSLIYRFDIGRPVLDLFKRLTVYSRVKENKLKMAALRTFSRLLQRTTLQNARSFYIYSPDALTPQRDREPDWKTAEDAVSAIESGIT